MLLELANTRINKEEPKSNDWINQLCTRNFKKKKKRTPNQRKKVKNIFHGQKTVQQFLSLHDWLQ